MIVYESCARILSTIYANIDSPKFDRQKEDFMGLLLNAAEYVILFIYLIFLVKLVRKKYQITA